MPLSFSLPAFFSPSLPQESNSAANERGLGSDAEDWGEIWIGNIMQGGIPLYGVVDWDMCIFKILASIKCILTVIAGKLQTNPLY